MFPQVADPLGGSFYIEALTSAMEEQAERVIQEVEHLGGMTEAIISGWWGVLLCLAGTCTCCWQEVEHLGGMAQAIISGGGVCRSGWLARAVRASKRWSTRAVS